MASSPSVSVATRCSPSLTMRRCDCISPSLSSLHACHTCVGACDGDAVTRTECRRGRCAAGDGEREGEGVCHSRLSSLSSLLVSCCHTVVLAANRRLLFPACYTLLSACLTSSCSCGAVGCPPAAFHSPDSLCNHSLIIEYFSVTTVCLTIDGCIVCMCGMCRSIL
jgi:hypothetical protein